MAIAGETAEQDFSSGLSEPQDGQDFGGGPGAGDLPDVLAPTRPLQHHTRPLQRWPRALRKVALWMLGLLDLDTLRPGLQRQRASLPSKIIPRACLALEMDSPSKPIFQGWLQEVC